MALYKVVGVDEDNNEYALREFDYLLDAEEYARLCSAMRNTGWVEIRIKPKIETKEI